MIEDVEVRPLDTTWVASVAGRLDVLRGRDVDGLEVVLEPHEGTR